MEIVKTNPSEHLEHLWAKANDAVPQKTRVFNLILSGVFPIEEPKGIWIQGSLKKAKQWQSYPKPVNLIFSHGDYILRFFKGTQINRGIDFLADELRQKTDTNRACWSLLTMELLRDTPQDVSIPSFMVLQAGLSENKERLILTAYFRALEVNRFLPINLGELCLIASRLHQKLLSFPLKELELNIHAFSAYNDPDYSCLEKAEIDYYDNIDLTLAVGALDTTLIARLLEGKTRLKESQIIPVGVTALLDAIQKHNRRAKTGMKAYAEEVTTSLTDALELIKEYNEVRTTSSYHQRGGELYEEIRKELKIAIDNLTKWK